MLPARKASYLPADRHRRGANSNGAQRNPPIELRWILRDFKNVGNPDREWLERFEERLRRNEGTSALGCKDWQWIMRRTELSRADKRTS